MRNSVIEDTIMGPAVYSNGDKFVDAAREVKSPAKTLKLARQALDADLDCIDAYILISHQAATLAEKLTLLREATLVGDRLWQPYTKKKDMQWWRYIGTRPYMRALHEFGLACMAANDDNEAEVAFAKLLKLNPNDNQGVRELLQERYADIEKLLQKYPKDYLLGSYMAKLACLMEQNNFDKIKEFSDEINERNQFVLPNLRNCLISKSFDPLTVPSAGMVGIGSFEEAMNYICVGWDFWSKPKIKDKFGELFKDIPDVAEAGPEPSRTKKSKP
jgi:tetratricopeptide (TPR) repeat protein